MKKMCVVRNIKLGTLKEYVYLGTKESIDSYGQLKVWHMMKEKGQGNKKAFGVLVGSKWSEVFVEV